MHKWDPSRIGLAALALLSVVALVSLAIYLGGEQSKRQLVFAAGSPESESFVLCSALKTVVEQHHPHVQIQIAPSGGTSESLRMLSEGRAQMAAAQADIAAPAQARIVSILFADVFQLMVDASSKDASIADLKGKRIALPRRGGQFVSFVRLAEHFGLSENDFHFVGQDDRQGEILFAEGRADALFRVRALGSVGIARLIRQRPVRFLPIAQAAAMRIKNPAMEPASLPEGAYLGSPAIPAADLPTVAVPRTLLAHSEADATAVRAVTETLMERRQEISDAIDPRFAELRPLLASIRQPDPGFGLGPGLHAGAQSYYDRNKPSFFIEHADYVGFLLTLVVLGGSWLWELKRLIERRQKNHADIYSGNVIDLMNQARTAASPEELESLHSRLLNLLTAAVRDLDADRISEESFQSFRAILQIALSVIERRRAALANAAVSE